MFHFKQIVLVGVLLAPMCLCRILTENIAAEIASLNGNFDNGNFTEIDPVILQNITRRVFSFSDNQLAYLPEDMFSYNPHFETLILSKNGFANVHPKVFSRLRNLMVINMDHNRLSVIDEFMFKENPELVHVSLKINFITEIHPRAFVNAKKLYSLHLNRNKLKTIAVPTFQSNMMLGVLSLDANQITVIPTNALSGLWRIKYLFLGSNKLKAFNWTAIPAQTMEGLALGYNQFTDIDYVGLTADFGALKYLTLSGNKFNCSFARKTSAYLLKYNLKVIDPESHMSNQPITCISDAEYGKLTGSVLIADSAEPSTWAKNGFFMK